MKQYQVVLESGGKVIPGGHTPCAMAAKQVWDNEVAPGRSWAVSGMGANVRTSEVPSAGGGSAKPMKMYLTPIVTFGFGVMRGYSPANHQPYSSNAGWINPGYPVDLVAGSCWLRNLLPGVKGARAAPAAAGAASDEVDRWSCRPSGSPAEAYCLLVIFDGDG